jgi:hypothetical protein
VKEQEEAGSGRSRNRKVRKKEGAGSGMSRDRNEQRQEGAGTGRSRNRKDAGDSIKNGRDRKKVKQKVKS